jgi:hypothetical protein
LKAWKSSSVPEGKADARQVPVQDTARFACSGMENFYAISHLKEVTEISNNAEEKNVEVLYIIYGMFIIVTRNTAQWVSYHCQSS